LFFYANTKANEHGMKMCKEHKGVKNNNILWHKGEGSIKLEH
jgi:hypothetical protein